MNEKKSDLEISMSHSQQMTRFYRKDFAKKPFAAFSSMFLTPACKHTVGFNYSSFFML